VSGDGGEPETLATITSDGLGFGTPQLLPGGQAIVYSVDYMGAVENTTIEAMTLADRRRTILVKGAASPRFVATSASMGHLLYASGPTVFAVPFDSGALQIRGPAVPVLDRVATARATGAAQFDVSRTGTLVYRTPGSDISSQMTLAWIAPSGKSEPLRAPPGPYLTPSVSADGNRIALIVSTGSISGNVAIYDIRRDAMTRLTPGVNMAVLWAPGGQHVVFSTPAIGISIARADGATAPQPLVPERSALSQSFSPDGRRLAYTQRGQLWTVSIERVGDQ
jgi:serine/threonine-protein kinase